MASPQTERGIDRAIRIAGGIVGLAYHAGVTTVTVYKWRRVGGIPSMLDAHRVHVVTGVDMHDLVPTVADHREPRPTVLTKETAAMRHRSSRRSSASAPTLTPVSAAA